MATSETLHPADVSPRNGDAGLLRRTIVRPHLREALGLLLEAYEYAMDLGHDAWDLAVELHVLRNSKLTNSDLRWLAAKGFVEHGTEITGPDDESRHFRRAPLLMFNEQTCVVLTRSGVALAREACSGDAIVAVNKPVMTICDANGCDDLASHPKWDQQRRQLRVGAGIVKEFKLPSPNQETVLTAFEEEGWPPRIDDPLRPIAQLDPRRRLHDTIKALNRNHKHELVRFRGDGSGEGVLWEFTAHHSPSVHSTLGLE